MFCNIYLAVAWSLNTDLTGFTKRACTVCDRMHDKKEGVKCWLARLLHSTLWELVTCPVGGSSGSPPAIPQVTSSRAWLAFVYFARVWLYYVS